MPVLAGDSQCILLAPQHSCLGSWAILSLRDTLRSTAGSQIRLFHSRSFCYQLMRKKCWFLARATVCVEFTRLPHVCVGFLQVLRFPPKVCMWYELACLNCPSLSVGVCEWPCDGRPTCPEWVPTLYPELPGEAPATCDTDLEWTSWKIMILLVFIHPSWMHV